MKISSMFKCNGELSGSMMVFSGIRQAVLYHYCFLDMYADELIAGLEESDLRCHFGYVCICCIAYADDIILISESVTVLQKMLDIQGGPKKRIPWITLFGVLFSNESTVYYC